MHIKDFFDLSLLEQILDDWSKATGMAIVVVDAEGAAVTKEIGYTDFCKKYAPGIPDEALRSSSNATAEITCFSHEGLTWFSVNIEIDGTYLGKLIGGQVLTTEPDEEQAKNKAADMGVQPDTYWNALQHVPVKSDSAIRSAAKLLGNTVNLIVGFEFKKSTSNGLINTLEDDIAQAADLIEEINEKSLALDKIESKQKILSLNASIEAARAGEFGRGFAVVASEFGKLAVNSGEINRSIKSSLKTLTTVIEEMEASSQK